MEKWVRGNNLSGLRYQTVGLLLSGSLALEMN